MIFLHVYSTHAGLSSHQKPTLAKSAQSLTAEKSRGRREAKHVTRSPIHPLCDCTLDRDYLDFREPACALALRHRLSFSNVGYGQKGFGKIAEPVWPSGKAFGW